MDQASAQTEKIASYETSRTRRSIVDGNIHSDDSNNDEEYASSGFYVREKTTEKRPESAKTASKESNKDCKENGILADASNPASPKENGENSRDGESNDSKSQNDCVKTDDNSEKQTEKDEESGSTEDIEPEKDDKADIPKEPVEKKEKNKNENCAEQTTEDNEEENENCNKNEENVSSASKQTENHMEAEKNESDDGGKEAVKEDDKKIDDKNCEKESETKDDKDINDDKDKTDQDKDKADEKEKQDEKSEKNEKEPANSSVETVEDKSDNSVKDPEEPTSKENKGTDVEMKDAKDDEKPGGSILKEHLEKSASGNTEENEMDMDEDFDPSLLCPDISMDVDEAPVITSEPTPEDGSTSPLPYEATFSTLVDEITGAEVQVDLTPEEMELRQKMYGPDNLVQTTKIHCTACNVHLGSALTGANNRFVHPLLKVLICKNCYHFYTSGEFEKDEDGSELYCRWCGQGGQVLCCSSCEFVFCKRCIRNNFGPKKFKEIRDSDDWNCFRCDRGQLSNLRASCAEFMEYYRTELARAQSLSQTNPELMTTDYTRCCKGGSEKKEEPKAPAAQKNTRRKRKDEEDPDYQPVVEGEEEPPKKKFGMPTPSGGPGYTVIPPAGLRPVPTKPNAAQLVQTAAPMQGQKTQNQGQIFKVGSTTFRARTPTGGQGYTVQRPTITTGQKSNSPGYITIPPSSAPKTTSPGYITIPPTAAPKTTSPGYIKILPQRLQGPRPTNSYTVVSGTSNGKPTFTTVRPKQIPPMPPAMKHEWFEKTVRAAARVNSNLSYTLTQLNRQQSQANSVEALAMVHNKLQEVLSTSINSLIQIRKNLRTEFISGIKNIKFPPKPAPIPPTSGPIVVKDDDDVIFVNPSQSTSPLPPPPPLVLSPSVSLTKKTPIQKTSDPFADPKPSTSGVSSRNNSSNKTLATSTGASAKGGFLKVRSLTALQSVPSECITIPDDPPTTSNGNSREDEDPLKITDDEKTKEVEPEISQTSIPPKASSVFDEFMVYNTKDEPTSDIKKMMNAVVMVKKSRVVDEIIRAQGLLKKPEVKEKENDEDKEKDSHKEKETAKESTEEEEKTNESDEKEKETTESEGEKDNVKQSDTKDNEDKSDAKEKNGEKGEEDSAKSEETS